MGPVLVPDAVLETDTNTHRQHQAVSKESSLIHRCDRSSWCCCRLYAHQLGLRCHSQTAGIVLLLPHSIRSNATHQYTNTSSLPGTAAADCTTNLQAAQQQRTNSVQLLQAHVFHGATCLQMFQHGEFAAAVQCLQLLCWVPPYIRISSAVSQNASLHSLAAYARPSSLPNLVNLLVVLGHDVIQQQHATGLRPGLLIQLQDRTQTRSMPPCTQHAWSTAAAV